MYVSEYATNACSGYELVTRRMYSSLVSGVLSKLDDPRDRAFVEMLALKADAAEHLAEELRRITNLEC